MKHTKGPWKWEERTDNNKVYGDGKWLVSETGDTVVDYLGCGTHECEVTDGDAKLIAAAPTLLNALELAETYIENGKTNSALYVIRLGITVAKGE